MTASLAIDVGATARTELQGGSGAGGFGAPVFGGGAKAAFPTLAQPDGADTLRGIPGARVASGGCSGSADSANEQSFQSRWQSMLAALEAGDSAAGAGEVSDLEIRNAQPAGTERGAKTSSVRSDSFAGQRNGTDFQEAAQNLVLNPKSPPAGAQQFEQLAISGDISKNSDPALRLAGSEKASCHSAHPPVSRKHAGQTIGRAETPVPLALDEQQSTLAVTTAVPVPATLPTQPGQSPAQPASTASGLNFLMQNTSGNTPGPAVTGLPSGQETDAASAVEKAKAAEHVWSGEEGAGLRAAHVRKASEGEMAGDAAITQTVGENAVADEGVQAGFAAKAVMPGAGEQGLGIQARTFQQAEHSATASRDESATAGVEKQPAVLNPSLPPGETVAPAGPLGSAAAESGVHGAADRAKDGARDAVRDGAGSDGSRSGAFIAHAVPADHGISPQVADGLDASTMVRNPAGVHGGAHISATIPPGMQESSAAAGPQEAFAALDAGPSSGTPAWVHAGPQRAEAGFEDPALGWVGVRAQFGAGGVHANIVSGSAEAAQALGGHMTALSAHLAAEHITVQSLSMSAGNGRETLSSGQQGAGQSGAGQQGHGREAEPSGSGMGRTDERFSTERRLRDGAAGVPPALLPPILYGPETNGRHVSVMA